MHRRAIRIMFASRARRLPIIVAFVAACIFWASGFCLASAPAWSPDGTKLLYSYRIDTDTYGLALHERTSGETRTVRRFPKGVSVDWVGWRPDGKMAVLNTGGQILQLDPATWDTVRSVNVDDRISEPVIVGRHLFFLTGAKKRKLVRLELDTNALLQQKVRVSHIFSDGNRLYYVRSPSKSYTVANHTFGQIDLDTFATKSKFWIRANSYPKVGRPVARGERIAFVSTVDEQWLLHVFKGNEPAQSIPISDETGFAIQINWSANDRLCVVSLTMNPMEPEPVTPVRGFDEREAEVEIVTRICEFDLESDSKTCKTSPGFSLSIERIWIGFFSTWKPSLGSLFSIESWFLSMSHDRGSLAYATKWCAELYGAEVAHPPQSYALPPDYAQLGRGVVVSGYEAGSEMFDLTAVRNRLSKYLRKRRIALANDPREFPPLIAGDLRLPLMMEKIEMADGNLLLHLTIGGGFFTRTLTLECFDPAGNSMWVEKVEVGYFLSSPRPRTLWKRMKAKLASHVDELRREGACSTSGRLVSQEGVAE